MARARERVRLEDGLKLDLNKLIRDGFAKPGECCRNGISWKYTATGETVASGTIEMHLRREGYGTTTFDLGKFGQIIRLIAVSRHFGGLQWYFLCPALGRKVAVMWCPPGANSFRSRQAWGRQVAYGSQFETWNYRALSRAQDIRYRLGGIHYVALDSLQPPKPKGMHWRTYEAQLERAEAFEIKCDLYLTRLVARLKNRPI